MSIHAALARLGAIAMLACVVSAVTLEALGITVPLGVINEGRGVFRLASASVGIAAAVALVLLVLELRLRRPRAIGSTICALILTFVSLEAALYVADVALASRRTDAPLGGPYFEVATSAGAPVILKKGGIAGAMGFRNSRPVAPVSPVPRLLFLGDSYTEGSGHGDACNYPQVVESSLTALLGRPVEVLNAGVAGYGPVEAANLLDFLVERGFRFDVVVYSLFLENDFTDDLPGTERHVVAGMPFRAPSSRFLALFDPLHSRLLEWATFLAKTRLADDATWARTSRSDGACVPSTDPVPAPPAELLTFVLHRAEANYASPGSRTAESVVAGAVARMNGVAHEGGAPFVLVVFPDRILADSALRRRIGIAPAAEDLDRLRRFAATHLPRDAWIDLTPALGGDSGLYEPVDTHLSDDGNRRAGSTVARALFADAAVRKRLSAASRAE